MRPSQVTLIGGPADLSRIVLEYPMAQYKIPVSAYGYRYHAEQDDMQKPVFNQEAVYDIMPIHTRNSPEPVFIGVYRG